MDKVVHDESVFDEESPFTGYLIEKFVYEQTGKSYFFSEWIRPTLKSENSLVILTANDGTDDFIQAKILKSESGYFLTISK